MKSTYNQDEFEEIEAYILNKLDDGRRKSIELKIQNDPQYAATVESIKQTIAVVNDTYLEQSALDTIKTLQQANRTKILTEYPTKRTIPLKYIAPFAAAAIVLLVSYFMFSPIEFPDTENDFYVTRGIDTTKFNPEQRIAFSQFFDGQAHLAEGQYLLAVKDFENSINVKNIRPYFREATLWHLAVAYSKSGQALKAEKIFTQLNECSDCEYPVSTIDRWKLWLRIQWEKFV